MAKTDTHGPDSLSMASEDYLESIYRIMKEQPEDNRSVRSVDVAEQLGVSKASVSKALSFSKFIFMLPRYTNICSPFIIQHLSEKWKGFVVSFLSGLSMNFQLFPLFDHNTCEGTKNSAGSYRRCFFMSFFSQEGR